MSVNANGDSITDPIVSDDGKKKDVVDYDTFSKLLGQRKADQAKLKEVEDKLKSFEAKESEILAKEKALEEKKLLDEGNWKSLLESREKTLKEFEAKNATLKDALSGYEKKFTDAHKINAFQSVLGGSLKNQKYYDFIDTSKIALDPDTGAIDDKSLKSYVSEFLTEHKDLVKFKSGSLPSDAPKGADVNGKAVEKMTTAEIEKELRKFNSLT